MSLLTTLPTPLKILIGHMLPTVPDVAALARTCKIFNGYRFSMMVFDPNKIQELLARALGKNKDVPQDFVEACKVSPHRNIAYTLSCPNGLGLERALQIQEAVKEVLPNVKIETPEVAIQIDVPRINHEFQRILNQQAEIFNIFNATIKPEYHAIIKHEYNEYKINQNPAFEDSLILKILNNTSEKFFINEIKQASYNNWNFKKFKD